ncbi:AAA family ATPase [Deinococcus sp.]|uniref:AAA family ATPase n=1 Tax=Deinococcus sp. TaxID=47478 RepID=UPI003C7E19F8
MNGPILLLSGVPGTGKSSLARAWLQTFPRGLHLPIDDLRELVVSGLAHPSLTDNPQAIRQFALARRVAFTAARLYAREGFAVAIDDVLWPHAPDMPSADLLAGLNVTRVFLAAPLETVLRRNRERSGKPFEPEALEPIIRALYGAMLPEAFGVVGWHIVNTEGLNVFQALKLISTLIKL